MSELCDVYIGTYTEPIIFGTGERMQGKGEGIQHLLINCETGEIAPQEMAHPAPNPSFLCLDPNGKYLYAVNELKRYQGETGGSASAFRIGRDGLELLSVRPTKGEDPCFITVSPDGKCAIVSNFMTGSITVYPIAGDGSLQPCSQFFQHEGNSADPVRQKGPHAHAAVFSPDGEYVLIPDLGMDCVVVYRYQNGHLTLRQQYRGEAGNGPRYCEFHPSLNLCYLVNELSSTVSVLEFDRTEGLLAYRTAVSTLMTPFEGANICADLHVSEDGRFLYVSNRGADTIVVFALDEKGMPHYRQTVESGGRTPRNFALIPGSSLLVAANQDTDDLAIFRRNREDGTLTKINSYHVLTPVCVRPLPNAGGRRTICKAK